MTIRYAIFLIATLLLTGVIGYGTVATARLLRTWRPAQNPLLLAGENAGRILLIAACIVLGLVSGVDPAALGWQWANWPQDALLGLAIGLALAGFLALSTQLLLHLGGGRFYSRSLLEIILPRNPREFWLILLAFIPAALLEELLFRSLLVGGLSPLLPPALLVTGVGIGFGLLHTPQGGWGVLGAALSGIVFGWLLLATGGILAPAVAHYVANVAQVAVATRQQTDGKSWQSS